MSPPSASNTSPGKRPFFRLPRALLRWLAASALLSFPQGAGPIAFSLLALSVTGNSRGGAAMILAMTAAQIAGVLPFTRLGSRYGPVRYLRFLIVFRTLSFFSIALAAWFRLPFPVMIVLSGMAGLVTGAAQGYLRVILNHLVDAGGLPRALGLAASLNEVIFVLAPVVASALGTLSPALSLCVIAALGLLPALLLPGQDVHNSPPTAVSRQRTLTRPVALWLVCATAVAAVVGATEIGAVALALEFHYTPAYAVIFTVPLCLASVIGGALVSIRNRMSAPGTVLIQLLVMITGAIAVAVNCSVITTIMGVIFIGSVTAPLGTHFSLILDRLSPPHQKAQVFALLRTAIAAGIIIASALLTAGSLSFSLTVLTAFLSVVTAAMAAGIRRK
ncbi:MFS transporter [Pantoea alhagi]|uniref:MFS transporter n=1 Tax=Pantoea alhagi TaxID=1891675 RepID=A0A1W6BBB1_9GAMM|nr:MFS transporter [Pantoea alhagi]ARJ44354.1 MFS transporter [Pantoea alhagi]